MKPLINTVFALAVAGAGLSAQASPLVCLASDVTMSGGDGTFQRCFSLSLRVTLDLDAGTFSDEYDYGRRRGCTRWPPYAPPATGQIHSESGGAYELNGDDGIFRATLSLHDGVAAYRDDQGTSATLSCVDGSQEACIESCEQGGWGAAYCISHFCGG